MTGEADQLKPRRGGLGTRVLIALVVLAFVIGALLMAWLSQSWSGWKRGRESIESVVNPLESSQNSEMSNAAGPSAAASSLLPATVDLQAARVADLEQRLTRISVAAQAASYNANRAEALLTAFAARRALDAGRPLAYVESTLRLRFGDAQPRAVATIINAAAEPVTLMSLRGALDDITAGSRPGQPNESWWSRFGRELGGLVVLRKATDPSPEPEQRLLRARRATDMGQIDAAVTELSALPPQPPVSRWLEMARRYNEAHRALDVIEAAAILEPRTTQALDVPVVAVVPATLAPPVQAVALPVAKAAPVPVAPAAH